MATPSAEPDGAPPSRSFSPLRDVWLTLRPPPDGRDGPLPPLLVALTVVTGVVDAFSYLGLGHVFVANMTGNVVFVAFALVGAPGFSIWASLLAIGSFSVGAVAGGRVARRNRHHRGRHLALAASGELALVTGAWIYTEVAGAPFDGPCKVGLIILLGVAMGVQNATARSLAVPDLTTTVLTLTLTGIGADGPLGTGGGSKVGRRLLSVTSMFLGALVGAVIVRSSAPQLTLLVAVVLLAGIALRAHITRRGDAPWMAPR